MLSRLARAVRVLSPFRQLGSVKGWQGWSRWVRVLAADLTSSGCADAVIASEQSVGSGLRLVSAFGEN